MLKKQFNYSKAELKLLFKLIAIIDENLNVLKKEMVNEFKPWKYEAIDLILPDDINNFIESEINAFLTFLKTQDISLCLVRGEKAGNVRVTGKIILSLYNTFYNLFFEFIPKQNYTLLHFAHKTILLYLEAYEKSLTKSRDEKLYSNQQQLYSSLIRTISKQQKELTEKERLLQEAKMKVLEEKEQAKTDFLVNLSHEIKLPLTIVRNAIASAIEEAGNRKLPSLGKAAVEVENLTNLIIDMLDYEKIKHGKILYNNEEIINISNIVRQKAMSYKPIAEQNKLTLSTDIREGLYSRIETRAMDRILNNLLDNAVKYNRENGEIRVSLIEQDSVLLLQIRDTGTGIPADQLPHIFKPYYQSMTTKKNIQGIGAGLPLVKSILDEVDGKIDITSIEDEETTVTITLLKKDVTENDTIIENPRITKPISRKNIKLRPETFDVNKKTVLVVEDKIEMVKLLEDSLFKDYNFYSATDGKNGLNKLNTIPRPDVIISDIMMDVMDGYEFLRCLKEMDKYKAIPLIFLTAKTSLANQLEGLAMGAVEYIPKPFEVCVLKAKIAAMLNSRDNLIEYTRDDFEARVISIIRTPNSKKALFDMKMDQYNLSPREKEVLPYVLDGCTYQEIGEILHISKGTIKKHIQAILEKCDVKRAIHLVKLFND